jgi:predicted HicB family RNase H-like nuclease
MAKKNFNNDDHLDRLFGSNDADKENAQEVQPTQSVEEIANTIKADVLNVLREYLANESIAHDEPRVEKPQKVPMGRINLYLPQAVKEFIEHEAWKAKKNVTKFINEDVIQKFVDERMGANDPNA